MPNWCNNVVTFEHEDQSMIERIANVQENLFSEFFPIPEEIKDDWYSFNIENFGTKWDVDPELVDKSDNSITVVFDSAWSPPVAFYNKMLELGYKINATYIEEGMCFCGIYEDGDDNFLDYSELTPDLIREQYAEFDEEFNLAEMLEEYEEEEDEDEM